MADQMWYEGGDRFWSGEGESGDRINNLSAKGDRYYCESWLLGDRLNDLSINWLL
jgi:hypothetical protein